MLTIVVLVAGASCAIRAAGGGGMKSTLLLLHLPPPWQVWQPAWKNRRRPVCTSALLIPPLICVLSSAPLGVRTPKRTHSLSASSAGTATLLPGSVTVSCGRPAFGLAKLLTTPGALLISPSSPISRPWFSSSTGGGPALLLPGPETLRMLASKSCTSSKIAE